MSDDRRFLQEDTLTPVGTPSYGLAMKVIGYRGAITMVQLHEDADDVRLVLNDRVSTPLTATEARARGFWRDNNDQARDEHALRMVAAALEVEAEQALAASGGVDVDLLAHFAPEKKIMECDYSGPEGDCDGQGVVRNPVTGEERPCPQCQGAGELQVGEATGEAATAIDVPLSPDPSTFVVVEALVFSSDDHRDSSMVCVVPSESEVAALLSATPSETPEDPANVHLTLMYLAENVAQVPPDYREQCTEAIVAGVADWRSTFGGEFPIRGDVTGISNFGEDGECLVAIADAFGLAELYGCLTRAFADKGLPWAGDMGHDFTPHIALAYDAGVIDAPRAVGLPLTFEQVRIVWGNDRSTV